MQRNDVTFQSAGTRCAAWLYRPAENGGGSSPCVILAHGFSGVRDQRLDAYAERFAQAGLAALVFDYRYFGDSDGEPRQLLDIRRQLEDWRAAIAFARKVEGVDPARIAIWGTSFSGGHVMTLAAHDPSLAAAVSQVSFADGLMTLPSQGIGEALRLTRVGLRDHVAALRGRAATGSSARWPIRRISSSAICSAGMRDRQHRPRRSLPDRSKGHAGRGRHAEAIRLLPRLLATVAAL